MLTVKEMINEWEVTLLTWSNRLKIRIIPLYCVFTPWLGAGPSLLGGGLFNGSWGGGAGNFIPTKWERGKF